MSDHPYPDENIGIGKIFVLLSISHTTLDKMNHFV